MATLSDRLDAFPEAWKPEPGDKLEGTVTELDERDGGFGPYVIVMVTTDDGRDVAFHAYHTVAARELARQRPVPGDRIGIKYHGVDPVKKYRQYRLVVDHATATDNAPDWDAIGAAAAADTAVDAADEVPARPALGSVTPITRPAVPVYDDSEPF